MTAYLLSGETRYRDWVLEYAGAWRDRILQNKGKVPTNIGLDGTIGGEWGGKWYGGTFGWNFDATSNSRNYYMRGVRIGMGNAFLLTRDTTFLDPLRRQLENLYAAKKEENGRILLPNKFGDNGWWAYGPNQHLDVQRDLYLWTMEPGWLERLVPADPWIAYLNGKSPAYPEETLRRSLTDIRRRVQGFRNDSSTPDSRASDHAQRFNPVVTTPLLNLMNGANDPGASGNLLHARFRYFDAERRRAGLPDDVGALVDSLEDGAASVTLVNLSQTAERTLIVQTGAYAEHTALEVTAGDRTYKINAPYFTMRRYANQPTLTLLWDQL